MGSREAGARTSIVMRSPHSSTSLAPIKLVLFQPSLKTASIGATATGQASRHSRPHPAVLVTFMCASARRTVMR